MLSQKLSALLEHPEAEPPAENGAWFGSESRVPRLSAAATELLAQITSERLKDTVTLVSALRRNGHGEAVVAAAVGQALLRQRGAAKFRDERPGAKTPTKPSETETCPEAAGNAAVNGTGGVGGDGENDTGVSDTVSNETTAGNTAVDEAGGAVGETGHGTGVVGHSGDDAGVSGTVTNEAGINATTAGNTTAVSGGAVGSGSQTNVASNIDLATAKMLFTPPGLEQSTRAAVAQLHAERFSNADLELVADLGCGIGADAMGLAAAGIQVIAVDRDQDAALCAAFNLAALQNQRGAGRWEVWCSDAETAWSQLQPRLNSAAGLWFDPARREGTERGKRLSAKDWSPGLDWVFERARELPSGIKLGPALEHELIPNDFEAQWLSVDGSTIELVLWSGILARQGVKRCATVMRNGEVYEMRAAGPSADAATGPIAKYLHEPDGAVIRAQLIGQLAADLDGWMLDEKIAYIASEHPLNSPFAQSFEVLERMPFRVKQLRRALADAGIGTLEIKKRGVDVDPATLRRELRLKGPNSATLILTRLGSERVALLARRV